MLSSGVLLIPVVATALTGTGVFATSLVTMLDKSLITKKRKSLKTMHLHIKEVYDKLHYYFQRVCDDNVITLDEIEKFDQIANEANKTPFHLKSEKVDDKNKQDGKISSDGKISNEENDKIFLEELKTLRENLSKPLLNKTLLNKT